MDQSRTDVRSEEIIRRRTALGWSQQKLATGAGVALTTISKIELGHSRPNRATLTGIARALGCSVGDLIPSPTDNSHAGKNGTKRRARGNVSDSAPKRRQSPKGKPSASSA